MKAYQSCSSCLYLSARDAVFIKEDVAKEVVVKPCGAVEGANPLAHYKVAHATHFGHLENSKSSLDAA